MDVKFKPWVVLLIVPAFALPLNPVAWGQSPVRGGAFQPASSTTGPNSSTRSNQSNLPLPVASQSSTGIVQTANSQSAKINWIDGKQLAQALKQAAQENKPLVLHFWNERCRPCLALEQFVFPNPILVQAINSQFIAVKINTLETPDIPKTYGVTRWPWDLYLSSQGVKLLERASPNNVSQYTQSLNSVAKMHGNFMKSAQVSNASPLPQKPFEITPVLSTQPDMQSFQSPRSGQSLVPESPINPPSVQVARQPETTPTHQAQAPQTVNNEFYKPQPSNSGAANDDLKPVPLPPIGLEGFCPVSLLKETRKIAGSQDWGCIHRGKIYFFTNQVNRDTFLKTPDRYAPVLAGYDVVIYEETGKLVEGKSEFGGFVGTKANRVVFLFASEENKNKFIKDETGRYIEAARVATNHTNENWLR
ncbi:MAG: thioredoxin family protein [Planctomycetota bacterium]|nr:thioredoxin family protein [Planctomycetota bacterium]